MKIYCSLSGKINPHPVMRITEECKNTTSLLRKSGKVNET